MTDEDTNDKPRKRRRRLKNSRPLPKPNATAADYMPKGAPLDAHGNPIPDSIIDPREIDNLGFDAESARAVHEHHEVLRRKNRGEEGVKWHGDPRWRFKEVKIWKPHAMVSFVQLSPHKNEGIPPRPISSFSDYQELIGYLRHYWRGGEASFKWTVYDDQNPTWTAATVYFHSEEGQELPVEDDEMSRQGQQPPYGWPPGWLPQWGPPPMMGGSWGPAQPPGWGYSSPQAPMPPPTVPQPPLAQGPASNPQPAGAVPYQVLQSTDPTILAMMRDLMAHNAQLGAELAQLKGQANQQQSQYPPPYMWPYLFPQQQQPEQKPEQPPPPPPKSAVEQLIEMASVVKQVNQVRTALANEFNPNAQEQPDDNPIKGDDDFPLKFKEVGPIRYMAGPDGTVTAPIMANLDKAGGVLDAVFGRVEKMFDKATTGRVQAHEKEVELMERANKAVQTRIMLSQYEQNLLNASRPTSARQQSPATVQPQPAQTMQPVQSPPTEPAPAPQETEPESAEAPPNGGAVPHSSESDEDDSLWAPA